MKLKSYILLLGLLIFLGETASIPMVANTNVKKSSCKMRMACKPHPAKDCSSHGDKKAMNCIDCPLCYLTVATLFFTKTFTLTEAKKTQYRIFKNTYLSTYYSETWKPPDV